MGFSGCDQRYSFQCFLVLFVGLSVAACGPSEEDMRDRQQKEHVLRELRARLDEAERAHSEIQNNLAQMKEELAVRQAFEQNQNLQPSTSR